MVQGGMSVVKFLVFVFNFVFVVCGIALIAVGVKVQISGNTYTEFLNSKFLTAPAIVIALGVIIFFIAFLGCCGALKENSCMVITFGVLLFLIFVVELAAGISAYVYRKDLDNLGKENMMKSLDGTKPNVTSRLWDDMESSMECCGVNGPQDYLNLTYWKDGDVSPFCCSKKEIEEKCDVSTAFKSGCYPKLKDELKSKIAMVGGAGIGIAFIEILGMIFAWCLASAIKKEYEGV